ncbi:TetR/AcrR family transcriptional regulator [Rhodococcus sp. D2-41]|uniref:TetR/AcrR family transcriptional regulator n=1 Tax=Speluncibacter jeojiensis TaxID=2710754 RepID=UPI00240FF070|nr:TetR/AcrR family transcriptional regulator [Rhodococcus sp. D2-41]MDG3009606.1 TetR/AcrR family transcriptional regulator [Rhodococcus sp. D2-41]
MAIAHDYVDEHGLDALTVRRLAVAADVTPGALYKHFKDQRDLRRAMADAVYATIDLSDIDTAKPSVEQVIACCLRMRTAMLSFRDGGRIVAGSYSPFAATAALGATLRTLLQAIALPSFDAGNLAYVLRNYTVGFVIEEQAYLALVEAGEWDDLVQTPPGGGVDEPAGASDAITILSDDRNRRFRSGIEAILAGTVT